MGCRRSATPAHGNFIASEPDDPNTGDDMNATRQLHDLGQSLWLDNITRALLTSGTLSRYIRELAVTGLTSNPTIFDEAIKSAGLYDEAIQQKRAQVSPERRCSSS
jgi:hypothetical protein